MKHSAKWLVPFLAVLLLMPATMAAKGEAGPPEGKGNNRPDVDQASLFGDLVIIFRDGNGEPILDAFNCPQPMDATCQPIPMLGAAAGEDEDPCDLAAMCGDIPCADLLQEITFGRLSVTRAPESVLESSYAEALKNLNAAALVTFDVAGRLAYAVDVDGVLEYKAIDSPLENSALYWKLMTFGYLPGFVPVSGDDPRLDGLQELDPALTLDDLGVAAALFAGGADKAGWISMDTIINVNNFLGLNSLQEPEPYFDFSAFSYVKGYPFVGKETDLLIYDYENPTDPPTFTIGPVVIEEAIPFTKDWAGACSTAYDTDGGAYMFTQAAEEARAVIWFIHNWAVPEY
jgi:hypothetical protein